MTKPELLEVGTDFSGIGSVDQALKLLGIRSKKVFACDWDKFARKSYAFNYGRPDNFPKDVHEREIPSKPLGLYVATPPCQAFSMAGKRKGEEDKRGILFYNSHEFIMKNRPRFFIFENVKGLLSHDRDKNDKNAVYGRTFNKWIQFLGGKSINGNPVLFPIEDAAPYHIYFKVLNALDYGIPQNRERIFIVGIRDDEDNRFTWPKPEPLSVKLEDILEHDVPKKYFLNKKTVKQIFNVVPGSEGVFEETQIEDGKFLINSATKCGYEVATMSDSINFSVLSSETRRGRVGKGVAQTLDTACNQGIIQVRPKPFAISYTRDKAGKVVKRHANDNANTLHSQTGSGGNTDQYISTELGVRRFTPRECFRLMGFPDSFQIVVSDAQCYKQAGNSIVVHKMAGVISKLLNL